MCWAQQLQGSFCSQGAGSFVKVTTGSSHGVGKPCSTFSVGAASCRVQGMRWEQNRESTLVCLLMDLAVRSGQLCVWNQVKSTGPRGPREDVRLPHFSEPKTGMTT